MTRSKTVIRERIAYWEDVLEKTQAAYLALLEGRVKAYTIDDRSVTRLDLPSLEKAMEHAEEMIDRLEAALEDRRPRKAVAVIPRDY